MNDSYSTYLLYRCTIRVPCRRRGDAESGDEAWHLSAAQIAHLNCDNFQRLGKVSRSLYISRSFRSTHYQGPEDVTNMSSFMTMVQSATSTLPSYAAARGTWPPTCHYLVMLQLRGPLVGVDSELPAFLFLCIWYFAFGYLERLVVRYCWMLSLIKLVEQDECSV